MDTRNIRPLVFAASPNAGDASQAPEQRAEAYASRLTSQIANIESGSEAERNAKFLAAQPLMTPAGYFSGGLLAAGYDPNREITATFKRYVGKGHPEKLTGSDERTYRAWQIAAGVLEHDRPAEGGMFDFASMKIKPADRATVNALESIGARLESHWERDIAEPVQDASSALAARSGKADVYRLQTTLQSLRSDKDVFAQLSDEGQRAINRTVDHAGQAIIPNLYGYPMAGYAFVPYRPYDGNYENRPNQGLMIDLNRQSVSEIKGDKDFAIWANRNRDDVLQSFDERDREGGLDAHWPKAGDVLDNLVAGRDVSYPGYKSLVSDQRIPVGELFNFTRSRGSDYQLKYGDVTADSGIASQYQALDAHRAASRNQAEVFGADQQRWKSAKEFWARTFGAVPLIGNLGNIAFGAHDSIHGMTAKDRIGGNVTAAISSLQLAHELGPTAAGLASGKRGPISNAAAGRDAGWKYDSQTTEFRFNPPQRVNGRIGYPMSPVEPPRLAGEYRLDVPGKGEIASSREALQSDGGLSQLSQGAVSTSSKTSREPTAAASRNGSWPASSTFDESGSESESVRPHDPLLRARTRKVVVRPRVRPAPVRSSSSDSLSSVAELSRKPVPRRVSPLPDQNRLSSDEEAGFRKHFPGGLGAAESYLKARALGMNRSPAFLSSDQYLAPRSWEGMPQKEINRLADRYLSVWEPEPKRADFQSEEEFAGAHHEYSEKMEKYRENGDFNIQQYWDDLITEQNNKFRTFVDSQTKRLAIATKAYDDFTANPTGYRAKPDDPYTIRKQLTGAHDGKRDAMYLQREALNFGDARFYRLDGKEINELRSSFLSIFGRDNSKIEAAFMNRKNELEDELYRYGNAGLSRETVEAKKKALQDRFNGDIETAIKNMDLMYKRIALYGTIGTLSISAVSAILWKTIDEIRGKK